MRILDFWGKFWKGLGALLSPCSTLFSFYKNNCIRTSRLKFQNYFLLSQNLFIFKKNQICRKKVQVLRYILKVYLQRVEEGVGQNVTQTLRTWRLGEHLLVLIKKKSVVANEKGNFWFPSTAVVHFTVLPKWWLFPWRAVILLCNQTSGDHRYKSFWYKCVYIAQNKKYIKRTPHVLFQKIFLQKDKNSRKHNTGC